MEVVSFIYMFSKHHMVKMVFFLQYFYSYGTFIPKIGREFHTEYKSLRLTVFWSMGNSELYNVKPRL